ncbi:MAG: Asp23/Gls24 family envelope stress response protein [Clostridia bacterium]|nr:Asp23/Gls24 family envelope stress response protein [Clostridia bacterium]
MSEKEQVNAEISRQEGGRIIFADDVVATIASLAAADVPGVASMSGGVVEGFTEKLGKKSLTKGVKVEVGQEEAAIDISVLIKYGYRIREVCGEIQKAAKTAVETMTGLRVVEVNGYVQAVVFEQTEPTRAEKRREQREKAKELEAAEREKEKESAPEPAPRVK